MGLLCSLEIELLSNRKSAWYFIFTSLFIRLQFKFNHLFTAFMSNFMVFESSRSKRNESGLIIYCIVKFILVQTVGFKISWSKILMSHDEVDSTKCLFRQLPIFTQFPDHMFAQKSCKNLNLSLFLSNPCNIIAGVSLHSVLLLSILFIYFYLSLFRFEPNFYLEPARDKNMKSKLMIQ